jgi:hypothetical protein
MARIRISVTDQDIIRATRENSMRCVVARAIARTIPHAHSITVDIQTIRWTDENGRQIFLTPDSAASYVIAFDAGETIHPFSINLDDRNRVAARVTQRTDAGRAIANAARRVRRQQDKLEAAESPHQITEATQALADAKAVHAAVMGEHSGQVQVRTVKAGRKAPRTTYKTNRRAYGNRVLRINQEDRT